MTVFQRWTKKAAKTVKETVSEMAREDVKESMDIAGDVAKLAILVAVTSMALKSGKAPKPIVHAAPPVNPIPIVQIVLSEGKEVVIR